MFLFSSISFSLHYLTILLSYFCMFSSALRQNISVPLCRQLLRSSLEMIARESGEGVVGY